MEAVLDTGGGRGAITRQSLHSEIVSRVRDMIIEGELQPGTRIFENQLGEVLGVSRTPLREALKFLASEGLVDLVPSRGAVVRKFTPRDVQDMLVVIRSLEELAGRLACVVAGDAEIAAVRALHDAMSAYYAGGERLEYYKLNQQIHTAIVALAHNETLSAMHNTLQSRLKRIRFIGHEGRDNWAAAMSEHDEIIQALEARNAERLVAILGLHLANAWARVESAV